ncbi:uncharacterized protein LOC135476085 [Liolophura sinensis]|uniref:uncharacterized protein LOC135476085 n=1 Tax=Liolophura sinensis TaxID=3198878 RepID=UPI003158A44C
MPSTGDSSEEDEGPDDPESHRGLSHDGEPSASIPSSCGETPLTTVKSPGSSDIAGATQQTNSDDLIHQECAADITQLIRSLSPLPKLAAPRSRKRKSEEATLLTASPYKDQLVEKQNMKALKDKKGKSTGSRRKGKATTIKKPRGTKHQGTQCEDSDEDGDDQWPCLICSEPFSRSRSKEVWVQCMCCEQWAHEECTAGDVCFVCPNCDSGDSES